MDWNNPIWEKLWIYHLHYFDDLNSKDATQRKEHHQALINRWIQQNRIGWGNAWEPYPLSLRIINWIKWALGGNPLNGQQQESLVAQLRWLAGRLEWHLLGNHLYANAKALFFAGLFFEGRDAENWRKKGFCILTRQTNEQVLDDGGHFELSPMYHALFIEDVLDLINIGRTFEANLTLRELEFLDLLSDKVPGMLEWLWSMCHPDGEIAFFNDSAIGIAPKLGALRDYATRFKIPIRNGDSEEVKHLNASGYIRISKSPMLAILDVASIGPDYIPGHAHADTLSVELSVFGQRIIVNSGTSCYGNGPERQRQRGTPAHNTVEIDGKDSSEVWGGFRVARRAYPIGLKIQRDAGEIRVSCSHNGYKRLPGKPIHHRKWVFSEKKLTIEDRITGRFSRARSYIHFHPDVQVTNHSENSGIIHLHSKECAKWSVNGGKAFLNASTYHPEFGLSIPNQRLEIDFFGQLMQFVITIL